MALFGRTIICTARSMTAAALKNHAITPHFTGANVRWQSSVNRQRRTETVAASQAAFTPLIKSIGVDELHRLRQDDENSLILVDVRERSDTDQAIPGCINIPLESIQSALSLNRCEFRKKYRKPMDVDKLVFVCRRGTRSAVAAEYAAKLGCTNARFLQGGFDAYLNQVGSPNAL